MYGNILASCSYDRKVIIWKEENGTWEKTHEHLGHDSSGTGEECLLERVPSLPGEGLHPQAGPAVLWDTVAAEVTGAAPGLR